jgi:hypothetical protein
LSSWYVDVVEIFFLGFYGATILDSIVQLCASRRLVSYATFFN